MSMNNPQTVSHLASTYRNVIAGVIGGLCLLAIPSVIAQTNTQFSFGAKLDFSTWKGDNPGVGKDFEDQSSMLGIEAKVSHGSWFGGLTLLGGEFEFDDVAPARPTEPLPPSSAPITIKRGEVDLVLGYRFWPRVSLFLDIKNVTNKWDKDNYKVEYTGLGFGISGYHPLSPKWSLYGNFGLVPMNIKVDDEDVGDAGRSALNIGFLYRASERANFTIGLRSQNQTNDYDDGTEQTHKLGSLMFGINGQL